MITQTSGLAKLRRYIPILSTLSVGIALLIPLYVLADPSPEPLANVAGSNQAALLSAEFLETNDAVIGVVSIDNGSVFDLENPKENKWLFRLANTTHATTRPDEIRHQLHRIYANNPAENLIEKLPDISYQYHMRLFAIYETVRFMRCHNQ